MNRFWHSVQNFAIPWNQKKKNYLTNCSNFILKLHCYSLVLHAYRKAVPRQLSTGRTSPILRKGVHLVSSLNVLMNHLCPFVKQQPLAWVIPVLLIFHTEQLDLLSSFVLLRKWPKYPNSGSIDALINFPPYSLPCLLFSFLYCSIFEVFCLRQFHPLFDLGTIRDGKFLSCLQLWSSWATQKT